ncbi:MAG: bifunctional adenosylcobinamide kinase/adenosylcobinamide-phosphate guanylyltransferase [Candidatus Bruticola sp.]
MITLVLGGARSGKSSWAENYAVSLAEKASQRCYLAAGVACDEEMAKRIEKHQERRNGLFYTIEEAYDLDRALLNINNDTKVVLIDCLTTWLGNLTYRDSLKQKDFYCTDDNLDYFPEIKLLGQALSKVSFHTIMVSNELGWGIVPAQAESRLFRDRQGRLNQHMAALADQVVLLVAGLPLILKAPSAADGHKENAAADRLNQTSILSRLLWANEHANKHE